MSQFHMVGLSLSLSRAFAMRRVTFRPIKSIMLPLAQPRVNKREGGGGRNGNGNCHWMVADPKHDS